VRDARGELAERRKLFGLHQAVLGVEPQTPVSVRMASAVWARAKERISAVALAI
jgi:hypothetical protein